MADGPRFYVTMKTGNDQGAGTDGSVYVKFIGNIQHGQGEEVTSEHLLDSSGNDFENGDAWTYWVDTNRALAELSHIEVRLDLGEVTLANAWQLESIVVEDRDTHRLWYANAGNRWFDHTQDAMHSTATDTRTQRFALKPVTPTTQYRVTIGTADSGVFGGSGTDGFVFVGIRGDANRDLCQLLYLDGPGNDFERGSRADYGPFHYPALDPPREVFVRLDGRHPGDTWELGMVGITDMSTGRKFLAEINERWFQAPGRAERTYKLIEKDF